MNQDHKHPIYHVETFITNKLDQGTNATQYAVGIIGSNPSMSARSPKVWNKVFSELGMDAHYFSFDVASADKLKPLFEALRKTERFLGCNVTMPYKAAVIPFLDEVDPKAKAIGAVNTIVKTPQGTLIGYNTDGQGAIDNILLTQPGKDKPIAASLKGKHVLLLGAGGAAKASAFFLADALAPSGTLTIANRSLEHATQLAHAVKAYQPGITIRAVSESDVATYALNADLIMNATTKGQGGVVTSGTKATYFEPYSALGPADVASVERGTAPLEEFLAASVRNAAADIIENHRASLILAAKIPRHVAFVDAVHTPKESVFLLHGRLTGHATMNGVGMNVGQAIDGFYNKIMKPVLIEKGWHTQEMRMKIMGIMSQ